MGKEVLIVVGDSDDEFPLSAGERRKHVEACEAFWTESEKKKKIAVARSRKCIQRKRGLAVADSSSTADSSDSEDVAVPKSTNRRLPIAAGASRKCSLDFSSGGSRKRRLAVAARASRKCIQRKRGLAVADSSSTADSSDSEDVAVATGGSRKLRLAVASAGSRKHRQAVSDGRSRKITELHKDGKVSDLIYALAKGPDQLARVYNRRVLNGYYFRNSYIERDLSTQNSGVIVKGDEKTGNIDYYGVIKKIIVLDFPPGKEVVLFKCDWFDVPAANKTQSKGYKKDKYGIIDLDTSIHRFKGEPYILGLQAEQVFYVRDVKIPNWASVIKMNPRNLFAPSVLNGVGLDAAAEADEGGDADVLDVVDTEIMVPEITVPEEITSWSRNDEEGSSVDASVIQNIKPVEFEDVHFESDDDMDDDETYINDGHVAPLGQEELDDDHMFFV